MKEKTIIKVKAEYTIQERDGKRLLRLAEPRCMRALNKIGDLENIFTLRQFRASKAFELQVCQLTDDGYDILIDSRNYATIKLFINACRQQYNSTLSSYISTVITRNRKWLAMKNNGVIFDKATLNGEDVIIFDDARNDFPKKMCVAKTLNKSDYFLYQNVPSNGKNKNDCKFNYINLCKLESLTKYKIVRTFAIAISDSIEISKIIDICELLAKENNITSEEGLIGLVHNTLIEYKESK